MILAKRQDYDPARHGNIYDFVVKECQRLRYWQNLTQPEPEPPRPSPVPTGYTPL